MSVGRDGLRVAGGTQLTKCCGAEAIPPESDERTPDHVESGRVEDNDEHEWPNESEYDDAVELVCPRCGRTWRTDECEHDDVVVEYNSDEIRFDDTDAMWHRGRCVDCNERVNVLLEITDIRGVNE